LQTVIDTQLTGYREVVKSHPREARIQSGTIKPPAERVACRLGCCTKKLIEFITEDSEGGVVGAKALEESMHRVLSSGSASEWKGQDHRET
jgi:hypothetical protein